MRLKMKRLMKMLKILKKMTNSLIMAIGISNNFNGLFV